MRELLILARIRYNPSANNRGSILCFSLLGYPGVVSRECCRAVYLIGGKQMDIQYCIETKLFVTNFTKEGRAM